MNGNNGASSVIYITNNDGRSKAASVRVSVVADAVGTVRCRRSLHEPRHDPSGTGLSSAIVPAPPVAAPTTRAPHHLDPLLALGTRTSVRELFAFISCVFEVAIAMMKPINRHSVHSGVSGVPLFIGFIMAIASTRDERE